MVKGKALLAAGAIAGLLLIPYQFYAQELPADELQANLNLYADNFVVMILYPSLALSKKVTSSTSLTGRYAVDAVSAASMKSRFEVDGVTSATSSKHGGGDDSPDELRHELGGGVTQVLGEGTLAINGLYSTENDYSSTTLAGHVTWPFAKKNTVVRFGVVKSWDKVFPQIRDWEEDKDVLSLSAGATQVLNKKLLTQLDFSYSRHEGFLSNPYHVVHVIDDETLRRLEPVHPDERNRHAIGARTNYKLTPASSIQLGYRFYWDSWDVYSHTVNGLYQVYNRKRTVIWKLSTRHYLQTHARFFKPAYQGREDYMTVDAKLDAGYSNEFGVQAVIPGNSTHQGILLNARREIHAGFKIYLRHTENPDWHNRRKDLLAVLLNAGYRLRF